MELLTVGVMTMKMEYMTKKNISFFFEAIGVRYI